MSTRENTRLIARASQTFMWIDQYTIEGSIQGYPSRKNALVNPSIYSIRMMSCSLSRSEVIFERTEAWFNYLNCVRTTENNELCYRCSVDYRLIC